MEELLEEKMNREKEMIFCPLVNKSNRKRRSKDQMIEDELKEYDEQ